MSNDLTLLAAEGELTELRAQADAAPQDDATQDRFAERIKALMALIQATAPHGLEGAVVKLRLLADPHIGIEAGDR